MSLLHTMLVALLSAAPVAADEVLPQLSVRGEAALKVPADQASLRILVRAEADTAAEAMVWPRRPGSCPGSAKSAGSRISS